MLTAYALCATLALVALLASGAGPSRHASFDVIDVERINVRKPDGRLSMVLSNEARMPGVIHGGREYGTKDTSGIVFYNGDGDETGGLTFGSTRTDTTFSTFGHLSFDGYEQDQTLVLSYNEAWENGERTTRGGALRFVDRDVPGGSEARFQAFDDLNSDDPERAARGRRWFAENSAYGEQWANRVVVGSIDGVAYLGLNDRKARPRIRATVADAGEVRLDVLDAEGEVVRSLALDG